MYWSPFAQEHKEHSVYKLVCEGPTERVLGRHLVGANSGEVMLGFGAAIKMGAAKKDFDNCVATHPNAAEEIAAREEIDHVNELYIERDEEKQKLEQQNRDLQQKVEEYGQLLQAHRLLGDLFNRRENCGCMSMREDDVEEFHSSETLTLFTRKRTRN